MTRALAIAILWAATVAALRGQQAEGQAAAPGPIPGAVRAAWVEAGFPPVVDRTRPIGNLGPWTGFALDLRQRANAGKLVLPRDFEMVKFLLERFPGRHEDFDNFVALPRYFADTPYEEAARALLHPILKQEGTDPWVRARAGNALSFLYDAEAVAEMLDVLGGLDALGESHGAAAILLRRSIKNLGVIPPPAIDPFEAD